MRCVVFVIVAIHQPNYLPYYGYFDKIRNSDVFVFLDNVQFEKNSYTNRNRIKTPQRWCWLTVPVVKAPLDTQIKDMEIDPHPDWQEDHWKSFVFNYGSAPFFYKSRALEIIYKNFKWEKLFLLNETLIVTLCALFGLDAEFVNASQLNVEGSGTDLLLNICKKLKADVYLSGKSGRNYLEHGKFRRNGIEVSFQHFEHPVYRQQFGNEFLPNMSVIDMLFNVGELL